MLDPKVHYKVTIVVETEIHMNKAIICLMAVGICLLADPGLQYLARLGDQNLDAIAAAISLLSMPRIAS